MAAPLTIENIVNIVSAVDTTSTNADITSTTTDITSTTADIALNTADIALNTADITSTTADIAATPNKQNDADIEVIDIEKCDSYEKKKPGRPKGSKNKEQGKQKPRAKKNIVLFEKEEEEPPSPLRNKSIAQVEEEFERPLRESRAIPPPSQDKQVTMMLALLATQAKARKQKKVALWQSWFP
jgi:hypothetical protein